MSHYTIFGDPVCSKCRAFSVIQYDAGRHRVPYLPVICNYCIADREYDLKQEGNEILSMTRKKRSTELSHVAFGLSGPVDMFDDEREQLSDVDGCVAWAKGYSPQAIRTNADAYALDVLAKEVERLRTAAKADDEHWRGYSRELGTEVEKLRGEVAELLASADADALLIAQAGRDQEHLRVENAGLRQQMANVASYCRDMACRCPLPVVEWFVGAAKMLELVLGQKN